MRKNAAGIDWLRPSLALAGGQRLRGSSDERIDVMPQIVAVFPEWFVPNCPPADAVDASGTIYRFVEKNPIDPVEFQSYHERDERPNAPACERCGLSVFRKVEDVRRLVRHLWKNHPGKNYGPHIVKRDLAPTDG